MHHTNITTMPTSTTTEPPRGLATGAVRDFFGRASPVAPTLFLDYDGTLAPFRVERDEAVPYEGLHPLLRAIASKTATRLVIVSGRPVADVERLLALDADHEIWGCHGLEHRLSDGSVERVKLPAAATNALRRARQSAEQLDLGEQIETKPTSVAVHVRGITDGEGVLQAVATRWEPLTNHAAQLELHRFDGGIELRPSTGDKGDAVRAILETTQRGASIAYLGDDLTDEDAFAALPESALAILVRGEVRPTRADVWLRPPDELFRFLETWRDVFNDRSPSGEEPSS